MAEERLTRANLRGLLKILKSTIDYLAFHFIRVVGSEIEDYPTD